MVGEVLVYVRVDARLVARWLRDASLQIVGTVPSTLRRSPQMRSHARRSNRAASRLSVPRRRCNWTRRAPRRRCARGVLRPFVASKMASVSPAQSTNKLLARHMRLPHRRRDALPPVAVPLAEPAVGIALGVLGAVLLPEQRQRYPAPLQLRMVVRPVRLSARCGRRCIRWRKVLVVRVRHHRSRPGSAGPRHRHGSPTHVLADRRLADPRRLADKPPAHPHRMRQTQYVTYFLIDTLSAGIGHSLVARENRSADSTVDGSVPYASHHLLSAITGLLSALRWNGCPRCTGFPTLGPICPLRRGWQTGFGCLIQTELLPRQGGPLPKAA